MSAGAMMRDPEVPNQYLFRVALHYWNPATERFELAVVPAAAGPGGEGGPVEVSNWPATQPISALALPLPAGAATLEAQAAILSALNAIAAELAQKFEGGAVALDASTLAALESVTATIANWPAVQPVSLATVPTHGVTGPLTNAELRAAAVPVVMAAPALTVRNGTRAVAPAANAVLATTGPLSAGSYRIEWNCVAMDTLAVGKGCIVEHRNAADNANIAVLGGCVAGDSQSDVEERIVLAAGERIRVTVGSAAGAASSLYAASVAAYPVT